MWNRPVLWYHHTGFCFDFSHYASLSTEELHNIEKQVNNEIMKAIPVEIIETTFNRAREMGAIALFGEKYEENVRVIKIGDFSMELCGGTHLKNTGQAGMFKILSESGIAAGIRRIEAVTGFGVHEHLLTQEQLINTIAQQLKNKSFRHPNACRKLSCPGLRNRRRKSISFEAE